MLRKGDEPVPGYRLVRFLGRGQYGEVWQATGPGGTRVALKFIDVSGAQGQKELRGVQRVKEIRHPHLMPITALWLLDEDGTPLDDSTFSHVDTVKDSQSVKATLAVERTHPSSLVVAMGYCDKNLGDRLAELNKDVPEGQWQGIPPAELLAHMAESAKAIDFLNSPQHDLGDGLVSIQHCDIKPANIMLVGGSVQVCDFGLARMMGDNLKATATGMVGSPAYMAPECIRKRPSSASDQYSLAITYYELRTGRLPFHEASYMAVLEAHQAGALDFSGLGDAEQAVLHKATELEPEERYATCLEMVAALEEALVAELPDLRASPAVGKLHGQQVSPHASAVETVGTTSTAREEVKRHPARPRTGAKLGLALALLALIGIGVAAAFTVPAVREAVANLLPISSTDPTPDPEPTPDPDRDSGEKLEPTPTPIDFAALIADAEQSLQDDDLDEAARQFNDVVQKLQEESAQASDRLRDSARLGTLRVQARRENADWAALLADLQSLALADASDAGNAARLATLELIAQSTNERASLKSRTDLLVKLDPIPSELDEWEKSQVADLKVDTLADASQNVGSLDDETWDNLEQLGVDKVGLLLALAQQQHKQADFTSSRQTLATAKPDATPEQRYQLAEIQLMNDLADDTFDADKAVGAFASVAKNLSDPTAVAALLVERARRTPEVVDAAVEQLDQVRQTATNTVRSQLDKSYTSLLAQRIGSRLLANEVATAALMGDCESVRTIDATDPLVNVCWVECKLLTSEGQSDGQAWKEWDTIVQQALATTDGESPHLAYFHYVAGLLQHHHPTPRSRNGADQILKTKGMAQDLLQIPSRRRWIAEILVAAAADIGLPTDADLHVEITANEDTKSAYSYLKAASGVEEKPSDTWKANYVIAAALVGDREATDLLLRSSDELLAKEESKTLLESKQLIGQVLLLSAKEYARRHQDQRQQQDLGKAIDRYAALIARLHNPRRVNPGFADLALYTRVVQPACDLVLQAFPEPSDVPADLKPSVAQIHAAIARLEERDASVSRLVSADSAVAELVATAYQTASQLDERAEYLVGVGRSIVDAPDRIERLSDLQSIATRIQSLDGQHPGGYSLKGFALGIESRTKTKRAESRELLLTAVDAYSKAVELTEAGEDDYASNLEGLSAANLETAFYMDTEDDKRPHLERAERAAREALDVADRQNPENAFNNLGNSLEDQAFYLNAVEKYETALQAFVNGADAAADAGTDRSRSLYAAGRCRLRRVLALYKNLLPSEIDGELGQAERELDQAIAAWGLLPQKKAVQHLTAEAQYWRSEVIRSRAMRSSSAEDARTLIAQAETDRAASVILAKELSSVHWTSYQIAWSRLSLDRANMSATFEEARKFFNVSTDRANAVLDESKAEETTLQISQPAIRDALLQLVRVEQEHCNGLLKHPITQWRALQKEAEGCASSILESARRIREDAKDEENARSASIAGLSMMGTIKLKSARDTSLSSQQVGALLDQAEKSYRDAIDMAGDDISLSVTGRIGVARTLAERRIKTRLTPEEQKKVREEGLKVLGPLTGDNVPKEYIPTIIDLRNKLD